MPKTKICGCVRIADGMDSRFVILLYVLNSKKRTTTFRLLHPAYITPKLSWLGGLLRVYLRGLPRHFLGNRIDETLITRIVGPLHHLVFYALKQWQVWQGFWFYKSHASECDLTWKILCHGGSTFVVATC
jgi:hypothetical protein